MRSVGKAGAAGAVLGIALAGCGAGARASGGAPATTTTASTVPAARPAATKDAHQRRAHHHIKAQRAAATRTATAQTCAQTVAATLRGVAQRIYTQAAHGASIGEARRRLARSGALAAAVAADSPSATQKALQPVLKGQIHRIAITGRGGRVLARFGTTRALAPVHGTLARGAGHYVMAVATESAIAGVTQGVTGEKVSIRSGSVPGALHAKAFPSGTISVVLAAPTSTATTCGADAATTRVKTIGAVAERLLHAEETSPQTQRVLKHVSRDAGFQSAVARRSSSALRTAIIRMFRTHSLHVVRIRATDSSGSLIGDVGGPFALAPASTSVMKGGRKVGTVTLSIQDDTGYIKLVHRFTGAGVVLTTSQGTVPGSLTGASGSTFSFDGVGFPDTPLHITLHIPSS